ncbi:MAG: sodium/glutamate symporter, partial [Spirochaetales bacterium]|nr:sodium/glutamate symporter [Spirochaetales bacterium]
MALLIDAGMTIILAFPVLFAGGWLNRKIPFLNKFHIPEAISGGLLFSVLLIAVELIFNTDIDFNDELKNLLLLGFFSTIGLSSSISKLIAGGRSILFLLFLAAVYLFLQNFVGVGIALAFGVNPVAGLIGGSISLTGGHGTAMAWSTVFEQEYGMPASHVFGAVAATFGLILGGLAGGPVGTYLIRKNGLSGSHDEVQTVGLGDSFREEKSIDYNSLLSSLFLVALTASAGSWLGDMGKGAGLHIPPFVFCLILGILI